MLLLFTWPVLRQFTAEKVRVLIDSYKQNKRPLIEVENGWYDIEILGGEILVDSDYEPAFEFILQKTSAKASTEEVDVGYHFAIKSDTY
jgi:hypothetical protein